MVPTIDGVCAIPEITVSVSKSLTSDRKVGIFLVKLVRYEFLPVLCS